MPKESPVETFVKANVKGSLVLVAFPSTGSAASIAAQYMIRHLDLPLVGHIRLPELSGLAGIQDGLVTTAVRIYGGEVECKVGRDCPRVFIVTTEMPLPPPLLSRLAEAIIYWTSANEAQLLLVLEGVGREEGDDQPDVFSASADAKVLKVLQQAGIPAMERALVAGISAQILLDAPLRGVEAGGLFVEASRDHPDGRAAAALLEAVARLVPDVPVNAKPLMKEAMELEREIKAAQARAEAANTIPQAQTFI
ncbi:MAG: uncharacterized protein QOD77_1804 [Thermoplasmata archaeon]|jgi:predicted ATP-grasp superfamily ATP-dependent carboligase|nr:uncharacterized protein [Thermoplasmata archaeon]